MKKKVVTIIGARPQFIKASTVSFELSKSPYLDEITIHTGQHFDKNMSKVFFDEMNLPKPKYHFKSGGLSQGHMTGNLLTKIEDALKNERPDLVLVYGDTNSTLAGSLAASKLNIPIAHIESGLRSYKLSIPEEVNRVTVDHLSSILFCPNDNSVDLLKQENIQKKESPIGVPIIKNVGDVMLDAILYFKKFTENAPIRQNQKIKSIMEKKYYLCTIHRPNNTDDKKTLKKIISSLENIAKEHPIILPLHPRTKKQLTIFNIKPKHITIIPPVGYLDMIELMSKSNGIFTDSGGLQKEAYFLQKPCAILLDHTPWTELVKNKFSIIVNTDESLIQKAHTHFFQTKPNFNIELYGNGSASKKITQILEKVMR
tara:strand:- start:276 stop:1388 length:1113 start_codon:yes stop_codon:yes gene_type:complete